MVTSVKQSKGIVLNESSGGKIIYMWYARRQTVGISTNIIAEDGAQERERPAAIWLLINSGHRLQPCASGTKERIKGLLRSKRYKGTKPYAILFKFHLMDRRTIRWSWDRHGVIKNVWFQWSSPLQNLNPVSTGPGKKTKSPQKTGPDKTKA